MRNIAGSINIFSSQDAEPRITTSPGKCVKYSLSETFSYSACHAFRNKLLVPRFQAHMKYTLCSRRVSKVTAVFSLNLQLQILFSRYGQIIRALTHHARAPPVRPVQNVSLWNIQRSKHHIDPQKMLFRRRRIGMANATCGRIRSLLRKGFGRTTRPICGSLFQTLVLSDGFDSQLSFLRACFGQARDVP